MPGKNPTSVFHFEHRDLQLGSIITAFITTCTGVVFLTQCVSGDTEPDFIIQTGSTKTLRTLLIVWSVLLSFHNLLLAIWAVSIWGRFLWQRYVITIVRVVFTVLLFPSTIAAVVIVTDKSIDLGVDFQSKKNFGIRMLPLQASLLVATLIAQLSASTPNGGMAQETPGREGYTPYSPLENSTPLYNDTPLYATDYS